MTDGQESKAHPAARLPCKGCPWRQANQGTRHPHGWYTKANLQRLWAGIRRGEMMSCHPTDPRNDVPPGSTPAPEDAKTRECTGALILAQREFMRFQRIHEAWPGSEAFTMYRRENTRGLTLRGMAKILNRAVFGDLEGLKMTTPDLNTEGLGAPGVRPWVTDETRGELK